MATIKKFETSTKIEFHWEFVNFGWLQENMARLTKHKFEMSVDGGKNVQSKWQVGFKPSDKLQVYFKLEKKIGSAPKIYTKTTMRVFSESTDRCGMIKVENATGHNEEFTIATNWPIGHPEYAWNGNTDTIKNSNLYFMFKVKLWSHEPIVESQDTKKYLEELRGASLSQLKSNYLQLLWNPHSYDIMFACADGIEVGAHRNIISAQNTAFATMLRYHSAEYSPGFIKVDATSTVMRIILQYLYTGDLAPEWRHPENIVWFTYAVGKYELHMIRDMLNRVLGNQDIVCNMELLNVVTNMCMSIAQKKMMDRVTLGKQAYLKTV